VAGRLAVFDIDGTLTDTNGVDDDCYRAAVAEALSLRPEVVDWSGAAHVTDAGIFEWICAAHGRESVTATAMAGAQATFMKGLNAALRDNPRQFAPIAGAPEAVRGLERAGWNVAFATGCWGPSARLKLRAAGIDANDAVLACADDAVARADIVRLAIARARTFYGRAFDRVVVLGDGPWDVSAAIELELPFIGIGQAERAERLRRSGARVVLADYTDVGSFHDALEFALPPLVPGTVQRR
jgi:phosphoglycolate phosphatase-like HAD superfamily hydrolase